MENKHCTRCDKTLSLSEFSVRKRNADGSARLYGSWCKPCKRLFYRETKTCGDKVYSEVDGERKLCPCCKQFLNFELFYKNSVGLGGLSTYCKVCYKTKFYNRAEASKRWRKWRQQNPELHRASHRVSQFNRNSRIKAQSDGTVTKEFLEEVYELTHCFWCLKFTEKSRRTLEHLVELSDGGIHSVKNITMSCRSCNSARPNRRRKLFDLPS